jgi:hypothetical protein
MVKSRNPLNFMVGPDGFEPPTSTVSRGAGDLLRLSRFFLSHRFLSSFSLLS